MSDDCPPDAVDDGAGTEPLIWSIRPCARNWTVSILVVVLIVVLSLAVQLYFGGAFWAAMTLVLLGLSVCPHYALTRYELNDEGVAVRGLLATYRREWPEIRASFPDADGVLLSPLSSRSRLAYTRGVYVRFTNNRDEVLARVATYLERSSAAAEGDSGDAGADG